MDELEFTDNSIQVKATMSDKAIAFLYEACGELLSATQRNCRVDTGQTRDSFDYVVDEDELEGVIGSDYENAIWEEFGTGIYAVNGDGRQTPWVYTDRHGQTHLTHGKYPQRMLHNAFDSLSSKIERIAQERFGEID